MANISQDDLNALEIKLLERIEKSETTLLGHLQKSELYLLERLEKSETTLLKEFRKWAVPIQVKQRAGGHHHHRIQ